MRHAKIIAAVLYRLRVPIVFAIGTWVCIAFGWWSAGIIFNTAGLLAILRAWARTQ